MTYVDTAHRKNILIGQFEHKDEDCKITNAAYYMYFQGSQKAQILSKKLKNYSYFITRT